MIGQGQLEVIETSMVILGPLVASCGINDPTRLRCLMEVVCSMEASMCRVLQKKTVALPQAGVNFNSESNVVQGVTRRTSMILRQTHALPRTYTVLFTTIF